jgi:hypothetical protein
MLYCSDVLDAVFPVIFIISIFAQMAGDILDAIPAVVQRLLLLSIRVQAQVGRHDRRLFWILNYNLLPERDTQPSIIPELFLGKLLLTLHEV